MEEEDLKEMMARITMNFTRETERRDMAQQAIESVIEEVDRFNRDEVPNFIKTYNAEMTTRDVDKATRLEYFRQVVSVHIHKEVKELREAHDSWVSFKEALLGA